MQAMQASLLYILAAAGISCSSCPFFSAKDLENQDLGNMTSEAPFSLVRCTVDDLEEIVKLQYRCFPPEIRVIFMGCHSEAELPKITAKYIQQYSSEPNDVWIGVKDNETGKFVAGSNWKVYVNGENQAAATDEPPEWLEPEEFAASKKLIEAMTASRAKNMPGPFVCMFLLPASAVAVLVWFADFHF
jgi:hypothetical protein